MFNGSAFNSAAYNNGASRVRVLMASAILSASMSTSAEPLHFHAGVADATCSSALEIGGRLAIRASADGSTNSAIEALPWAKRAAGIVGDPTAHFFADRPRDLARAIFSSEAELTPVETVFRFGDINGGVITAFDVKEVVHRFFSDIYPQTDFTASAVVTRYGHSDVGANAVFDPLATRIQHARATGLIAATSSIDGDMVAGGTAHLINDCGLFAEAHLNGIQPGYALLSAISTADINGDRLAGAFVDGEVVAVFEAESIPGRGADVNDAKVSASLEAVWWTFTQENADIIANAQIEIMATKTHAAQADISASSEGEAIWSIIVEPRERIVASTARLEATPWRIRPAHADGSVTGTFIEDGRVALRGTASLGVRATLTVGSRLALRGETDSHATSELHAQAWRIVFSGADMNAVASVIRSRLSVNITNPAPEHRQMLVPNENRAMQVPYENRTMVVS